MLQVQKISQIILQILRLIVQTQAQMHLLFHYSHLFLKLNALLSVLETVEP
jgi:hypothetical protein